MPLPLSEAAARMAESARYALLCRMHPSLHHNMAGALQPIVMTAMILDKRLQQPVPDLAAIAKNAAAIGAASKQATSASKATLGWLAHTDNVRVTVRDGVEELLELLATELSVHGFTTVNEVAVGGAEFPRIFFRTAFACALLALCDSAVSTGTLRVTWQKPGDEATDTLTIALDGRLVPPDIAERYRHLNWDDAEALAFANGIALAHGDDWVTLRLVC